MTEERETNSWEIENEGTETTEGKGSGRSAAESSTTTMITEDEDKKTQLNKSATKKYISKRTGTEARRRQQN